MNIKNIHKKKNYKIFLIIFFIIIFLNNIILKANFYISYFLSEIEFKKNEKFLKICNINCLKLEKNYKKTINPKISIVSPIFNRERFILTFLLSIQYQNFIGLEIILVDDYSTDKSIKIIDYYKNKDKRIILIKNRKNKGTLISRNIGILFAKGKYIVLPDPDDILSKNILYLCYKFAEKYDYEIIRFNLYLGNREISFEKQIKKISNTKVNQPELSTYSFYGINELRIIDLSLSNKFIKKEVYIKAMILLNKYYLNMHMIYMEDSIINYILYRTAKSFFNFNQIGYYYIKHSESITNNLQKINKLKIKYGFIFLKILFEYSKNIKYEKDMANIFFTCLIKRFNIKYNLSILKNGLNFYYTIINMYLNFKFISKENKNILKQFKEIIERIIKI